MSRLLEQLGRQTVRLGTSAECELRVTAPYPNRTLALIVHQGEGQLFLVVEDDELCSKDGVPLVRGEIARVDAHSHFLVGGTSVTQATPEIAAMLMARGDLPPSDTVLVLGRDASSCHLVLSSPFISSKHASFDLLHGVVTDHGSTSGTFIDDERLTPNVRTTAHDGSVIQVGPFVLPFELIKRLQSELGAPVAPAPEGFFAPPPQLAPAPPSIFAPQPPRKHSTVLGTIRMEPSKAYRIGRRTDNDIILDHSQISSRHARLIRLGGHVYLEDTDSDLGTFVRGTRLRRGQRAEVGDGEEIRFGPMAARLAISTNHIEVVIDDREGWTGRPLFEIEAQGVSVVVPDRNDRQTHRTLLDEISFKALPGDFIALMGPSGAGKTTLLHALTGYLRPTAGQVLINGQPLNEVFDALRGCVGYVPQDDIIHPELTVFEAVRYSARFRLPHDYSDAEINERVHTTLARLGLEGVAHLQIGKPEQKVISGGQRKRVNIAMELVTDPVLLFLDEPTSGLAADDTTALVELLAGLAREQGKTIVATIHQPAKDEYEKFNLALVLGHGGTLLYFGKTPDAYAFFESWRAPAERQGLTTPRDMFAEIAEREARLVGSLPSASRDIIRRRAAQSFAQDFRNSPIRSEMYSGARSLGRAPQNPGRLSPRGRAKGQLRLLLSRYLRIKARDRTGSAILLLQAPLIGVLLALVFGAETPSVPYWCLGALEALSHGNAPGDWTASAVFSALHPTSDNAGALFFLVVSAVWFGTSNAAREVVSERAIFRRESMVNLQVAGYVLSKFIVLGGLCVLQCLMLLAIVFPTLGLAGGLPAFLSSLGVLVLTAVCSVALGLALSSFVQTSEAAMALTPIALIPQVVLGGIMVPVTTNPHLGPLMWFIPARWGFDGVVRTERILVDRQSSWRIPLPRTPESLPDFIYGGEFHCALAQLRSKTLPGAWGFTSELGAAARPWLVLSAMTLLLLALVTAILKRRQ